MKKKLMNMVKKKSKDFTKYTASQLYGTQFCPHKQDIFIGEGDSTVWLSFFSRGHPRYFLSFWDRFGI